MAYTTIKKPSDYFNTKLYTGNGSTNAITGVGFQPDWVWVKSRSDARQHALVDSVRGATKELASNLTSVESTIPTGITSFDADGFSLGSGGDTNNNGSTFVSWNWLASNTTASNTDGSITSTVSANTTSGFSIVSYTGTGANATVGHGLGVAPSFIIVKQRGTGGGGDGNWIVGSTAGIGWTGRLILNGTFANELNSTHWNNTAPTSTVFTLGTSGNVNGNTGNYHSLLLRREKRI